MEDKQARLDEINKKIQLYHINQAIQKHEQANGPRQNQPEEQSEFRDWLGYPQKGPVQNLKENVQTLRDFPYKKAGLKGLEGVVSGATGGFLPRTPWVDPADQSEAMKGAELLGNALGSYVLSRGAGKGIGAGLKLAGLEPKEIPYNLSKKLIGQQEREPEMMRLPSPPPVEPAPGFSNEAKNDLIKSLTEGKNVEQTQKEAAKDINRSYENQRNITRKNFNEFLEGPNEGGHQLEPNRGDRELLPGAPGNLGLTRKSPLSLSSFSPKVVKGFSKEAQELYRTFDRKSNLRNGHFLQSQLGKDVSREMNKANTDWDKVFSYIKAKDEINGLIDKNLEGTPHAGTYKSIKQYHKENVEPYRLGPIADIAEGKVTNPGNLPAIFKNKEPHIESILNHLPSNFPSKIVHATLGEIGHGMKPAKISALETELGNKKVRGYLSPEQTKNIRKYGKEYNKEQEQLENYKKRLENYEGHNKELYNKQKQDFEHKELAAKEKTEKKKELIRALATIGTGAAGLLVGSPAIGGAAATATYLSKPILEAIAHAIIKSREHKGL
jgi:hypothetical protein